MLENFRVTGVLPITRDEISDILTERFNEVISAIRNTENCLKKDIADTHEAETSENGMNGYTLYTWNGRMHYYERGFSFPTCNTRTMWDLWWCGNKHLKHPPYRFVRGYDLQSGVERTYLSKARKIVHMIVDAVQISDETIEKMTIPEGDIVFEDGFLKVCACIAAQNNALHARIGDCSYITIADLVGKRTKKQTKVDKL